MRISKKLMRSLRKLTTPCLIMKEKATLSIGVSCHLIDDKSCGSSSTSSLCTKIDNSSCNKSLIMAYTLELLTIRPSNFLQKCGLSSIEGLLAFLWNVPKILLIQGELLACPTMIKFGSTIIALSQIVSQASNLFL